MKKNLFIIFAALCAAATVSCTKEIAQSEDNNPAEEGPKAGEFLNPVTLTFTADPSTKVAISDKGVASWEDGDQIDIVSFDSNGTARKAEGVEVGEGGTFSATVEDSETYYAVYPSSSTAAGDILLKTESGKKDSLVVTIASTQDGSFSSACYYAAKTSKTAKQFNFKAVSGIIKFEADNDYNQVQIRNVESTTATHAFTGAASCTFNDDGSVNVTPKAKTNSTHTITLDGSGTYYAAIVGNAVNEATFRFSKDGGETYEPGVYYNNRITYAPAKIKNFGKLTDKIVTNVYVSADGTGDGLTEANPAPASDLISACLGDETVKYTAVKGLFKYTGVWNSYRMDGLTVHFAAGEYTDAFTVAGNNSSFVLTLQGETGAILKGGLTVNATRLATEDHTATVTKLKGLTFTATTGLTVPTGLCEVENCTFTACTRAASIGSSSATDDNLKVNFRNCLFSSNTPASNGTVNVPDASTGGILGFHNCRFENNTAESGPGSAIYTGTGKTAIFLNKCSFIGNKCTSLKNAYTIGTNDGGTRFAMNCCTVNAGYPTKATSGTYKDKYAYSNGASITLKGQSIIANSTVWTSQHFGVWGLVALGCATATGKTNYALVINSVMRQNQTYFPAYYLHTNYYQNLNSCLHSGADLTVVEGKHTVENTLKVTTFASPSAKTKAVDGITANYYTWNYASTIGTAEFSKPTKDAVIEAIEKTGESDDGEKDGFGKLFTTWLSEVDATAFTKDLIGTDRPEAGLCPGSVEQAQ